MDTVLNPKSDISIVRHGREQEAVIVIDDVLAEPDQWRTLASRLRYGRIGPYYPGLRADVPGPAARAVRAEMADLIRDTFRLEAVPPMMQCYFSIVTTPPEQLAPIQRLPHVDGVEPDRIAILVYLSGPGMGGTAFYRQRATGFETVDAERSPIFHETLKAEVAKHGLPPAAYIAGDTPLYEQIASYEARPNRALVYRSCALHCAEIAPGTALPANPVEGRLTVNGFLFKPAPPSVT